MINIQTLSKDQRYIIGVSGGPDSMALLHMCIEHGLHVVVAHMNYQKRESALRDENIVRQYCERYQIPCVIQRQMKPCKGNFQAFARKERYLFYRELLQEYHAEAVLLAHHLDDHLETYLMQKQRHSQGVCYGIQEETILYDCRILRPLLSYTKQELLTYCKEHRVPYGFDESNFSDDYTRNRIRHTQIDGMSRADKDRLLQEIDRKNHQLRQTREQAIAFLSQWQDETDKLCALDTQAQEAVLREWIYRHTQIQVSKRALEEIKRLMKKANNWTKDLSDAYGIYKEYGYLHIMEKKDISYSYVLHAITEMDTPYFHIRREGKSTEALTLYPDDFPITIRNAMAGDAICLRFGRKKLHRWFIDRKIPSWQRKSWPVVVNARGNVILVPQIGCDIAHFSNNPTVFVVK